MAALVPSSACWSLICARMSAERKIPDVSGDEKKKKSKLDKIFELKADNKTLEEENKNLRRQLAALKQGHSSSSMASGKKKVGVGNEEKLLEAMSTLKRVTVSQEKSLSAFRKNAETRRRKIEDQSKTIDSLKSEIAKLKRSQETSKVTDNDSVDTLRAKVQELQITCSEQEDQIKELEKTVKHLQKQLDSARSLMQASEHASTRSMRSTDTSISDLDVARLRKELAKKIERIVLLEFDLEMCRDELHSLQHGSRSDNMSPSQPSDAQNTSFEEDIYDSDDDEDDYD